MSEMPSYEKLGAFYLGRKYDLGNRRLLDEDILYDAKDLTTHAMCVGMTGSGKTGLCLSLLEEAAIDGIPAICLDPKGDLGNLLLSFPELRPSDFRPWVEPSDATRKGMTSDEYAESTAKMWKEGLASWGQQPDRIQRFRDAVDISIYTPGSNAGLPLTVLKNFEAPPPEVQNDSEAMREKIAGAASGILTLLGMDADPLTSREHILLSNIFDHAWRQNKSLDLPELIRQIQSPPIQRIGVLDLDTFLPASDRMKFAMGLNNLLASPSFAGWLEGEPLDIKRLLYTKDGKPRLSIVSIAHLNDSERMFFVTLLLSELLSWMRSQPGTSSLRALFYMDEVYGYFPPVSKPPSKPPMMTLLKQARAFGLGICLATQNPVDLDYKGLSNMGTWFLGRLQSQRDKERVLEGLEGAASQTGSNFNRAKMEQALAALGSRVFLMNNVHDDGPTVFQTRWALSYLRGPLSRMQIQSLMDEKRALMDDKRARIDDQQSPDKEGSRTHGNADSGRDAANENGSEVEIARPILPPDVEEKFLYPMRRPNATARVLYRPALLGQVSMHFTRKSADVDHWEDLSLMVEARGKLPEDLWLSAIDIPPDQLELASQPEESFQFSELPADLLSPRKYKSFEKELKDYLYRHRALTIYHCKALKRFSKAGQNEDDARIELSIAAREARDLATEKMKAKFADKIRTFESKIQRAELKVEKEKEQAQQQSMQSMLNIGSTILGALLGNKLASRTNVTRASSAAKGLGRAARERNDVARAEDSLDMLLEEKADLEREAEEAIYILAGEYSIENMEIEELEIQPTKSDIRINQLCLLWVPWQIDSDGIAEPLVALS